MSDQPTVPEGKPAAPRKRSTKANAAASTSSVDTAPAAAPVAAPVAEPVPQPVTAAPEISVKIRVLENGLKVAGGVAARGRVLKLAKSQAVALQELGKVTIVGV